MFGDNLRRICEEKGTTPTALCRELGLSTSKVSAWYGGSLPKQQVMVDLAHKLDCSVMDFFCDEEELTKRNEYDINSIEDEDLADIIRVYNTLNRRDKHEFMCMLYDFEKNRRVKC